LADGQSITKDTQQGLSYWKNACDKKDESACTMLQTVQKSGHF